MKTAKRRVSYDSLLWLKTGGFKKKDIRMDFVVVLFSFLHREETLTTFYALFKHLLLDLLIVCFFGTSCSVRRSQVSSATRATRGNDDSDAEWTSERKTSGGSTTF